jgi:hypothetical protein
VGSDNLHQEPRPPAGGRCLSKIHEQAAQPSAGEAVIVGRILFGGRHVDRSLGLAQELPPQGLHGQKRSNDTHASTTDPDSRLYRKAAGREAKLCYMGHATMENRNGLAVAGVDGRTTRHEGYGLSQSHRAAIECIFGYGKQHGTLRKTKHRGIASVTANFLLNLIAYNLVRIPKLIAA